MSSFWRNKRVLVTGHTGFKGGWLCLWLQEMGSQVTGYALPPPTDPNLFTTAGIAGLSLQKDGTLKLDNADQIERGYERIDERLNALGASIRRVPARGCFSLGRATAGSALICRSRHDLRHQRVRHRAFAGSPAYHIWCPGGGRRHYRQVLRKF